MKISADQVRAATRGAAAVIKQDTVPPLRLDNSPGGSRARHGNRTRPAWVAPLAAAAAIIIVAGGGVTANSLLAKSGTPRASRASVSAAPTPAASATRGASPGSYTGVPPYYVAVANSSLTVVRATWTGATLARITTTTPVVGVAGAADGRTFVLDEQRSIVGGKVTWVGQPEFYLLRLTASGTEESLTRLAVPAIPDGTVVSGLALSPDGSKLAVDVDTFSWPPAPADLVEIMTYTLATGALRSWTTSGVISDRAPFGFTGSGVDGAQSISWTADSRTLAFGVQNNSLEVDVRLLDTAAGGSDLMADSRLAAVTRQSPRDLVRLRHAVPPYYFLSCSTDAMISMDGSEIVCGYASGVGQNGTAMGFAEYSTATGKMNRVVGFVNFEGQAPIGISLYWVNSTGTIAIGTSGTSRGGRFGVMNGDTFTPLPGVTGFEAIAW
jgi:hypothetical protein